MECVWLGLGISQAGARQYCGGAGKATCHMLLLQGNCLVDASILSGEVLPLLPPSPLSLFSFDLTKHAQPIQ